MKPTLKVLSFCILFSVFTSSFLQAQNSYYEQLYYVCKAWGHAKYYHTELAKGAINWDDELLDALENIKNASDNTAFNQELLKLLNQAGEMQTSTSNLPVVPDSLNNNTDFSWIEEEILSDDVRSILDTIRVRFRPQSNFYVGEAWAGGNPTFGTDNQYTDDEAYPSEEKRILALFRYWNIINYFFPYKDIMDQDWDTTLEEFIPQIIEASDAIEYNVAFKRLTTRINDSHGFYYSPSYGAWLGGAFPPFLARYIEDEMVITRVLPNTTSVKVGDIIKEIDGENIYTFREELRPLAHGSNEVIIEREINTLVLRGQAGNFDITLENADGEYTESFNRNFTNYGDLTIDESPIWRDTIMEGNCHYGIVDMGRLEVNQIGSMFNDLWDTDAIIFDIRNYPNGTLWYIVDFLYSSSIHIANFTIPDITYPGRLTWAPTSIGFGTTNPYQGKIMILFDERTQSQAEYTCMGLEQFPGAIKIGSTTSAADGNVTQMYLPGQITTYATFLGTFYPDYTPTQRVGIIPDFEVLPTIEGIRSGQDEVLDFALQCDLVDVTTLSINEHIRLYPNPAQDEVYVEMMDQQELDVQIFNLQGQWLSERKMQTSGSLDVSNLEAGVYLFKINTAEGTSIQRIIKQ